MGFGFTPYLLDVDGDNGNELAVKNSCAPVGNCQFRLFKKTGKTDYEILLETEVGVVQQFGLRKVKTNGFYDLETTSHGDAWSGEMNVYKFDGKKYILKECFNYDYIVRDKNGRRVELKEPKLTSYPCPQ